MALCRCKEHSPPKSGRYLNSVEPVGFPNSSSICGSPQTKKRSSCLKTGMIWLTKEEMSLYKKGIRVFNYATNVTKVEVK